jgi:hypothetical protein
MASFELKSVGRIAELGKVSRRAGAPKKTYRTRNRSIRFANVNGLPFSPVNKRQPLTGKPCQIVKSSAIRSRLVQCNLEL